MNGNWFSNLDCRGLILKFLIGIFIQNYSFGFYDDDDCDGNNNEDEYDNEDDNDNGDDDNGNDGR